MSGEINPMNGRVKPDVGDPDFILKLNLWHHDLESEQVDLDPTAKRVLNENLWELYE